MTLQQEINLVNKTLEGLDPSTPAYEDKCWELYDTTRFTINDLLNWKNVDTKNPEFLKWYGDK